MVEPSSFCTMCTYTCYKELIGLLLSLSIHHPGAKFYCMVKSYLFLKILKSKKNRETYVSLFFLRLFTNYAATAGATRATGKDSPAARSRGKL